MTAPDGGHVMVVGVDGVRFDFLGPDSAPSVWALGQAGFLAPVPVDEVTPTWSGPCWATIATGTGVAGHGITGNDLTGHRLAEHPDFVTLATRAGLSTLLAVSGWPPLALPEDGGPLFAEASTREFTAVPETGLAFDTAREASREPWPPGMPPTRPPPRAPRRSWPDRRPGCRSSISAPSISPGTPPAREPPTGRRCGPPTSGSDGWYRRSAPGRPARMKTGRLWWSPTTGTWMRAGTAAVSPRSRPHGRPPPASASGRAPRR